MELQVIQSKIYQLRGCKVMLDYDLAELYQVETRVLNQAVNRNIKRFPSDFMFQLTDMEFQNLMSQSVISSWGGRRKPPLAFTEQGLAMLSGILNSDIAIEVNIQIMRAFVTLRQFALGYAELKQQLDNFMVDTNLQFNEIYQALTELGEQKKIETKHKPIGFKVYDQE
ncbi:hypothetical protein EZS27_021088 [termite gut metagenome]|uniref:KilA-N DNA-binding domain-containing protein n=1 Tax=termite gut metagenome TaxID=433724 RepID=A0A5J4R990_9ZZZZ